MADVAERKIAAIGLAQICGAETVLVLIRDREVGSLYSPSGLARTLPGGPTWRALLARCGSAGTFAGKVTYPNRQTLKRFAARVVDGGSAALVAIGDDVDEAALPDLGPGTGFPLLAALLSTEIEVVAAQGRVTNADLALAQASALAEALDSARAELTKAFSTAESLNRALIELNATLEDRVAQRTAELAAEMAEREKAEAALRQSQKMEAVGQLTGGVAHDFNNLLTVLRSSVDLLRRPSLAEERRRRYLDAISDTVDRAAKLTGQLLAFARRQALKPEMFDVRERIRAVSDMLDSVTGSRIRVVVESVDEPCFVCADVSQFETGLVNMAVNARDAMEGEGLFTIRLHESGPMPAIRGHAASTAPFVAISLTDSGAGISPELLLKIFEPFFTTKSVGKGTGLGLSQVFGFAKQSGGDVDVQSEVGRGTTFTLYLPQASASEAKRHPDRLTVATGGGGRRVLVVEDNIEIGRFATQILDDLGYQSHWAANADEALVRLASPGKRFDVVFSDVMMPGMNGVDLARVIRRLHPGLPIVLTSGYSHVLAKEGPQEFDLVHKPYSAEQLSHALRRAISRR
jgi:signal transduction histidine kinase